MLHRVDTRCPKCDRSWPRAEHETGVCPQCEGTRDFGAHGAGLFLFDWFQTHRALAPALKHLSMHDLVLAGNAIVAESRRGLVDALAEVKRLRDLWRSQDPKVTIDSIEYMDGIDAIDVDAILAKVAASA